MTSSTGTLFLFGWFQTMKDLSDFVSLGFLRTFQAWYFSKFNPFNFFGGPLEHSEIFYLIRPAWPMTSPLKPAPCVHVGRPLCTQCNFPTFLHQPNIMPDIFGGILGYQCIRKSLFWKKELHGDSRCKSPEEKDFLNSCLFLYWSGSRVRKSNPSLLRMGSMHPNIYGYRIYIVLSPRNNP